MNYIILLMIWCSYCLIHSFLISIKFTNVISRLFKKFYAFYRIFYIVISLILLIPLINYSEQISSEIIIEYSYPWNIMRYVWGALLIFFWAFFFNYDSLSFFGIRQILNLWKENKKNSPNRIKKSGLLGLTRHPMYLTLIIYLWCQTFRLTDLVVNIILTVYIIIGTKLEEQKLILEYGDEYLKYQQEVPMLIPFTKKKVIRTINV